MNALRIASTVTRLRPFPASKRGRKAKPKTILNYDTLFVFIPATEN